MTIDIRQVSAGESILVGGNLKLESYSFHSRERARPFVKMMVFPQLFFPRETLNFVNISVEQSPSLKN